jgi:hypothetical protein
MGETGDSEANEHPFYEHRPGPFSRAFEIGRETLDPWDRLLEKESPTSVLAVERRRTKDCSGALFLELDGSWVDARRTRFVRDDGWWFPVGQPFSSEMSVLSFRPREGRTDRLLSRK